MSLRLMLPMLIGFPPLPPPLLPGDPDSDVPGLPALPNPGGGSEALMPSPELNPRLFDEPKPGGAPIAPAVLLPLLRPGGALSPGGGRDPMPPKPDAAC